MTAEARLGFLRHRVFVDGVPLAVRRERGGWHGIDDASGNPRVLYAPLRDQIRIETVDGPLEIRFRWRGTTFAWRGRTYRVRSMLLGDVRIEEAGRTVIRGKTTWRGVRLDAVAPELEAIAPALAPGFAFRWLAFWFATAAGAA